MAQRVEYEALPGTRFDQYIPKLRQALAVISGPDGTDFKVFREHLRRLGLWDRDRAERMFSLIDLDWDRKSVRVGSLAAAIIQAGADDEKVKHQLFARLKRENVILVKYVLEALDVEGGGRLHSVHELYRMVTSYVYPGAYITLPNFQAWIDWLASSGHIKLVGIRWALSDLGIAVIPELRGIDVEEILEDMAEDEAGDEDEEDDLLAGVSAPVAAAPAVVPASSDDDDEEAFDDLPPEAPAPSAAAVAQAAAKFEDTFHTPLAALVPELTTASPSTASAAEARAHTPVAAAAGELRPARALAGSRVAAALVERTVALWNELGDWPSWTAPALGVVAPEAAGDALLLELGVLAALVEGLPPQPQGFAFARRLRAAGFFEALGADGGFGAAVESLGDLDSEPWARALAARLMVAAGMQRRLAAKPGLLKRIRASKRGASAVGMLRVELFGGAGEEAPFWVLRELVRLEVLAARGFGDAAAVPTAALVRNAHRLGLIDRAELVSFEELLAVSVAVSSHFGADAGYGEALATLDRGLGVS